MKNYIQFINHASIVVSNGNKSILTDPWYSGGAFDDGWSLIFQNDKTKIREILTKISYIWISMNILITFSIKFFKEHFEFLGKRNRIYISKNKRPESV